MEVHEVEGTCRGRAKNTEVR